MNENIKSGEELADEALDQVAGGSNEIHREEMVTLYRCNGCGGLSKQSDVEQHNGRCPKCDAPIW